MPLAPGTVSKRFVDHMKVGLDQLPAITQAFSDGHNARDEAWEAWLLQQPQRQRSYLGKIRGQARFYAVIATLNGIDHTHAITDSLTIPEGGKVRAWSYSTLARTACEAFIRSAVISDISLDQATRAGNYAAVVLWGYLEQVKLSNSDASITMPEPEKQLQQCEMLLKRAGFTIDRDSKNRVRKISRNGRNTNIEIDVTGETERRIPELPSPYRFGSAVAHSGAWFLASSVRLDDDSLEIGTPTLFADPELILVAVSTAMFAALASAKAVASPGDPVTKELRDNLMHWSAKAISLARTDHSRA